MKKQTLLATGFVIIFLISCSLLLFANNNIKIFLNNKEAKLKTGCQKSQNYIRLNLPFKPGENNYNVKLNWDPDKNILKINTALVHPEAKDTRSDKVKCSTCSGTGKCHSCWPYGSGNSNGKGSQPCIVCNGTGECWMCNGQGEY